MLKRILIAILVIAVLVFGGFGIYKLASGGWGSDKDKTEATTTPTPTEAPTQAPTVTPTQAPDDEDKIELEKLKLILTVDLDKDELEKMYSDFSYEFLNSSMPSRNAERTSAAAKVGWGNNKSAKLYDAVTFPFSVVETGKKEYTEQDIESMYKELQEEIYRNPVAGDMFAQLMHELELADGTTVAELNEKWLNEFEKQYDKYGCSRFVTYHTVYWKNNGFELPCNGEDVEEWKKNHPYAPDFSELDLEIVKGKDGNPQLYITDEYAAYAKRMLAWLDRVSILGVQKKSTIKHWPLNSTLDANSVRTHLNNDKNYVDNEMALIFSVERKDGRRELLFGFNVYDKRAEIFDPKPTPEVTTTPDPSITPEPTGEPTPEPTGEPDPKPSGDPKKDPKQDPVHTGNAPHGGGEGQGDTNPNPTGDPSQSDMTDAHGGPDQNQGHSNPETVKPTNPPSESHSDNEGGKDDGDSSTVEQTDSNPMNYGQEDHGQSDSATDGQGHTTDPGNDEEAGEFEEPPV